MHRGGGAVVQPAVDHAHGFVASIQCGEKAGVAELCHVVDLRDGQRAEVAQPCLPVRLDARDPRHAQEVAHAGGGDVQDQAVAGVQAHAPPRSFDGGAVVGGERIGKELDLQREVPARRDAQFGQPSRREGFAAPGQGMGQRIGRVVQPRPAHKGQGAHGGELGGGQPQQQGIDRHDLHAERARLLQLADPALFGPGDALDDGIGIRRLTRRGGAQIGRRLRLAQQRVEDDGGRLHPVGFGVKLHDDAGGGQALGLCFVDLDPGPAAALVQDGRAGGGKFELFGPPVGVKQQQGFLLHRITPPRRSRYPRAAPGRAVAPACARARWAGPRLRAGCV